MQFTQSFYEALVSLGIFTGVILAIGGLLFAGLALLKQFLNGLIDP